MLEQIANEAQPVIAQAHHGKKCGLLIDRNSVLDGNMSNDLPRAAPVGQTVK